MMHTTVHALVLENDHFSRKIPPDRDFCNPYMHTYTCHLLDTIIMEYYYIHRYILPYPKHDPSRHHSQLIP